MKCGPRFVYLAVTCFAATCNELSAQHNKPTPATAIAPFDGAQAKTFQAAWADYLSVSVEFTNSMNIQFAVVPPGEFMMGSPPSEPGDVPRAERVCLIHLAWAP